MAVYDHHPQRGVAIDAGEPAILLGSDTSANPAEYLLHALAACLTTSIVYWPRRARYSAHPSSRP